MNRYCQHYHKMGMSVACAWLSVSADERKKGGNPYAVIAPLPHYLKGIGLPEHSRIRSFLFPSYIASKRNAPHLRRIRYTTQSS